MTQQIAGNIMSGEIPSELGNLESLQNLRFQKALQQLENPIQIKHLKKEIAQLKTIIKEFNLGLRGAKDEN